MTSVENDNPLNFVYSSGFRVAQTVALQNPGSIYFRVRTIGSPFHHLDEYELSSVAVVVAASGSVIYAATFADNDTSTSWADLPPCIRHPIIIYLNSQHAT